MKFGEALGGGMAADDGDDIASQFSGAVTVKQVSQAVIVRGDEYGDLRTVVAQGEVVFDLECVGDGLKVLVEGGDWNVETLEVPFQAGEKKLATTVYVIVGVEHTSIVGHEELRDGGNSAPLRASGIGLLNSKTAAFFMGNNPGFWRHGRGGRPDTELLPRRNAQLQDKCEKYFSMER